MQHMVQSIETINANFNKTAAALIRSAWEDIQQLRREHLAGNQRELLNKRPDDLQPQLLTDNEEANIRQADGN